LPDAHALHALKPGPSAKVPVAQLAQPSALRAPLKRPSAHGSHVPALTRPQPVWNNPASQV
jgi:hypothetical protein